MRCDHTSEGDDTVSDEVENTPDEQYRAAHRRGARSLDATSAEPVAEPTDPGSADDTTTVPPPARPGVVIPRWVAILVGVLVVVLGSGAIGYAIGHDAGSDDHGRVEIGRGYRWQYGPLGPERNGQWSQWPVRATSCPASIRAPRRQRRHARPPANGAFLGVSVQADNGGVRITAVASDSPAEDAGLKTGDVVTALDGKSVASPAELVTQVQAHSSGDQVTIAYTRDGNSATAKVTLGSRADSGTRS